MPLPRKTCLNFFLSCEVPDITSFFESFAGKTLSGIPLCKLLVICKKLIPATRRASDIKRTSEGGKMHVKINVNFPTKRLFSNWLSFFQNSSGNQATCSGSGPYQILSFSSLQGYVNRHVRLFKYSPKDILVLNLYT